MFDNFVSESIMEGRIKGLTSWVFDGDVGGHKESKAFALELKRCHPMSCSKGSAIVDYGAVQVMNFGFFTFQMLHHCYL